jgi:hypothetical protein
MAQRIDSLNPVETSEHQETPRLSAIEAQALLRLMQPASPYDQRFNGGSLLPVLDGSRLYMRQF